MKKIILSSAAVIMFGLTNAQEVKFGVKGGLNLSKVTNSSGGSSLVGSNIGGFAEIKLNEKFAIQPELLYSGQGVKDQDFGDFRMNYINVPVMAKYFIAEAFNIEAGPQIGFLVSAKMLGIDAKDGFKTLDFGMNLGAGYDFSKNLGINLRYCMGISGVVKELTPGDTASKNSVIQLSAQYKF
jgi:Outer membrane protein beta-barrel domain